MIKIFWISVNKNSFPMCNKSFMIKTTCQHIGKIPFAEKQKKILSMEI